LFRDMTHGRIRTTLEMIKFEHSVFALPFALVGALLAFRENARLDRTGGVTLAWPPGWPVLRIFCWIIVAMVGARSAAMTINRIVDIRFDRENPRTRERALVTGALSRTFAAGFAVAASALLIAAAWQLNRLAFELSPLVLAVLLFYSYTKRFTSWSHVVLGFCLGISPAGAWIAVRGSLDWRIAILCAAVTLWVGGFDILYACQDVEFDRRAGLFSAPSRMGVPKSLRLAGAMHVAVVLLLAWVALAFHLAWPAWAGIAVVAALLGYEHSLVRPNDLSRINAAFFTVNGYISLLFLLFWGAAALCR
jgi:4-hydroxybenzoate polyprenyltransferase